MIRVETSSLFRKTLTVIGMNDPSLKTRIVSVTRKMAKNPFDSTLKTKQVYSTQFGRKWSSLVKNDLRIIWEFADTEQTTIHLLTVGGNKEPLKAYSN